MSSSFAECQTPHRGRSARGASHSGYAGFPGRDYRTASIPRSWNTRSSTLSGRTKFSESDLRVIEDEQDPDDGCCVKMETHPHPSEKFRAFNLSKHSITFNNIEWSLPDSQTSTASDCYNSTDPGSSLVGPLNEIHEHSEPEPIIFDYEEGIAPAMEPEEGQRKSSQDSGISVRESSAMKSLQQISPSKGRLNGRRKKSFEDVFNRFFKRKVSRQPLESGGGTAV
ncbi:hypothetical protein BX600DRAFT_462269 [Xylariales sp. PMI_506]|nr:hypothetical protein BX600DRAFT_462269 [Xylariales sp. PMI_506]